MKTLTHLFTNFKNSISRHIIAYFFMFAIIPLALVSFIFFTIYYQAQKDHIIRVQEEIAERLVQGITSQLHYSIEQCNGLTEVLNLSIQGSERIEKRLCTFLDHRPEYSSLCLKNLEGRQILKVSPYYTFRPSELGTVVLDEAFDQALRGDITIRSLGTVDFSMSPSVRITLPVMNLNETIIGVLEADVAVTSLWQLVSRESIGEHRYAYVVDSSGRLIVHRDLSQVLENRDLSSIQSVRNFTADRTGTFEYQGLRGVPVIGASASVSLTGWGIIVEEPVSTAFQKLNLLSAAFIGIFLITLSLALFLGLRFSYKNIVEPIRRLQKDAEYIAQGRFDTVIDTDRTDELGQLSDSFNRMVMTLKTATVSRDLLAREVEEKARIEESLREKEERYRLLFHQSPVGLFNYDTNLIITDCNERFADIIETTRANLIGLDMTRLNDQGVIPSIRRPLQGERGRFNGLYSATSSNAKKWISMRTAPLFDGKGTITGGVGIVEDITEQRTWERALSDSERKYRLLAENMKDLLTMWSMDLQPLYVSPSIIGVLGYSESEFLELFKESHNRNSLTAFSRFVTADSLNEISLIVKERLGDDRGPRSHEWEAPFELEVIRKDGTIVCTETMTGFLRDAEGQPTGVVAITRDITRRQEVEQALRLSEQRYTQLMEHATDIICGFDSNGYIQHFNTVALDITEYSETELKGKSYLALIQDDVRAEAERFYRIQFVKKIRNTYNEWPLITKSGAQRWVGQNVQLIEKDGMVTGFQAVSRDITDRKRLEKELKNREAQLRMLTDNISDVIWSIDLDTMRFTYISPSNERMTGFTSEEFLSIDPGTLLSHERFQEMLTILSEELELEESGVSDIGKTREFEWDQYHKDGHTIAVAATVSFLRNEQGKPAGIIGVSRDVSEKKIAQDALRESEKKYRTILETMDEGYYEVDLKGRLTFFNDSMCRILGYSRDDIRGRSYRRLMDDENAQKVFDTFHRVFTSGTPEKAFGWELTTKDNRKIYVAASVALLHDSGGNTTGFRGVVRDITQAKQAENALSESEKKYRTLVENMNDIFYVTDNQGMITYISPVVERVFGYQSSDVIGKVIFDFMPPGDSTVIIEHFREVISNSIKPHEYRLLKKDGSTVWVRTFAQPVYDERKQGHVIGLQGIISDITDRVLAEEALRAHQEHLGLINTILRHDIINDLTMMKSALNLYMDTPEEDLLQETLKRITKSIGLIRRMREFESFLSSHRDTRLYNIHDVIKGLLVNYPLVDIRIHGQSMVIADESLESVMDNIISNAIHHGKADRIDITIDNGTDDLCIVTIADNGTGISDDIKDKIFEEGFSRGDRENTGLGLYIVRKAMNSYGGFVHVEHNEPRGAIFVLRFKKLK